jgi:hypothetical protein
MKYKKKDKIYRKMKDFEEMGNKYRIIKHYNENKFLEIEETIHEFLIKITKLTEDLNVTYHTGTN